MLIVARFKAMVQSVAHRYGYKIERIVDYADDELNIFRALLRLIDPAHPDFFSPKLGRMMAYGATPINSFVHQFHWKGLLIEPQPESFEKLTANYGDEPQLILENVAISSDDNAKLTMYSVSGSDCLATFNRAALENRLHDSSRIYSIPVDMASFDTLVRRHDIQRCDLLQVDTEGFDYEVIRMAVPHGLPRPRLIQYEHLHLSQDDRRACTKLLAQNGYELLRSGEETIALARDAW